MPLPTQGKLNSARARPLQFRLKRLSRDSRPGSRCEGHAAAEADVADAAEYYSRTGSPALAAKFVAEFKRVATLLLEFPGLGSPRSSGRQGFSMSTFPYTVIYRASVTGILILVVKHDSRRPGYGGSRR
jgi:toxin ParE1/3/4